MDAPSPAETTGSAVAVTVPPQHKEARALAFTSFVVNGVEINLTMREGATAEQARSLLLEVGQVTKWLKHDLKATFCLSRNAQDGLAAASAAERVKAARENSPITPENGYEPMEDDEGQLPAKAALTRPARAQAPVQPTNGKASLPKASAPARVADSAPTRLTFRAERLIGESKGGKTYWKVTGGQFAKFGVRIWPEVMEAAGIEVDALDPAQEYELAMTAVYEEKDGKPSRVILLE